MRNSLFKKEWLKTCGDKCHAPEGMIHIVRISRGDSITIRPFTARRSVTISFVPLKGSLSFQVRRRRKA